MSAADQCCNPQARVALLAALGLLLGGAIACTERGQPHVTATSQVQAQEQAPYQASIQLPNNPEREREQAGEADVQGDATAVEEQADAARYRNLARITADQARSAALAKVHGTVTSVELENEDGNLVYDVTVKTDAGERDVKVDAGTGQVLHVDDEQNEQD